jgi:hypothetical protein
MLGLIIYLFIYLSIHLEMVSCCVPQAVLKLVILLRQPPK